MAWAREGECCKCGDCCRGNPIPGEWMDTPDGMCPLLGIVRQDGTRHCRGHGVNPYYLNGCNIWPTIPEHVAAYPRCTYTWRWVDDG